MAKRAQTRRTTRTPAAKKPAAKKATRPARPARARKPKAAPAVEETGPEVEVEEHQATALPAPEVSDTYPELAFAARKQPDVERPRPTNRRAVFFDVENTSRARDVVRMLEHLALDRTSAQTELVASGNWRVVGNETARLLAAHGAHLVHSAPATGVRDWSDLRIAVAAGVWLGAARPGDQLDIVSDDRAFDAVGDVAATLGVQFRRLSYRKLASPKAETVPAAAAPAREGRREGAREGGRGGRGRGRGRGAGRAAAKPVEAAPATPLPAEEAVAAQPSEEARPAAGGEGTPAPQDELLQLVSELLIEHPSGVSLDTVANRLRARGFERPPGSPRLVTRLRQFKELDVSPRGHVRLKGGEEAAPAEPAPENGSPTEAPAGAAKRRRRRGGRGRGRAKSEGAPPSPAE